MSTDDLLEHMATVLWFNGVWNARARGSNAFVEDPTARGAMLAALGLTDDPVTDDPVTDDPVTDDPVTDELPNADLF